MVLKRLFFIYTGKYIFTQMVVLKRPLIGYTGEASAHLLFRSLNDQALMSWYDSFTLKEGLEKAIC